MGDAAAGQSVWLYIIFYIYYSDLLTTVITITATFADDTAILALHTKTQ